MNPFEELLSAMAGVPVLAGALCRGRHALFDPKHEGEHDDVAATRHLQALGLCQRCPALDACEIWVASLPKSKRPAGVIAGQLNRETQPRKKRNASMIDPEEFDINRIGDAVQQRHRPPRDIIPGPGLTRDAVLALNDAAGSDTNVLHPGQMTFDSDGTPTGMTPSRTTTDGVATPIIPRTVLDQFGITPEEVPNVHIV